MTQSMILDSESGLIRKKSKFLIFIDIENKSQAHLQVPLDRQAAFSGEIRLILRLILFAAFQRSKALCAFSQN